MSIFRIAAALAALLAPAAAHALGNGAFTPVQTGQLYEAALVPTTATPVAGAPVWYNLNAGDAYLLSPGGGIASIDPGTALGSSATIGGGGFGTARLGSLIQDAGSVSLGGTVASPTGGADLNVGSGSLSYSAPNGTNLFGETLNSAQTSAGMGLYTIMANTSVYQVNNPAASLLSLFAMTGTVLPGQTGTAFVGITQSYSIYNPVDNSSTDQIPDWQSVAGIAISPGGTTNVGRVSVNGNNWADAAINVLGIPNLHAGEQVTVDTVITMFSDPSTTSTVSPTTVLAGINDPTSPFYGDTTLASQISDLTSQVNSGQLQVLMGTSDAVGVPEPGSLALLAAGAGVMLARRRKGRRSNPQAA